MRIEIIDSIEEFRELKSDWDFLYDKDEKYSVFQSFDYNYYSWIYEYKDSNSKLSIVRVELNSRIFLSFHFIWMKEKELDLLTIYTLIFVIV